MITNKILATALFFGLTYPQFRPNFIKGPEEDPYSELDGSGEQEDLDVRLSHKQMFSAMFSIHKGTPVSMYSYTNVFSYNIREDLIADVKIHGRFLNSAYQDIWGEDVYGRPHLAMDAGIRFSPLNNGLFDVHARTFHDEWWSGQSIYLTFLGIPVKRLYKSKSFDHYFGPNIWD